jgi:hypothetical protein
LKRLLNLALIVIFVLSATALFLAHEDPFARRAVCKNIGICPVIPNAKALSKIIYDLAVGALVTLAFYLLVVRLPDYERRQRLKRSLERHYRDFREDCIEIILMVADETYSAEIPETLIEQEKFREYFMQKITPDQTRWHRFLNNLDEDEYHLRELQSHMKNLREEIIFILNNTDISKSKPFEFLKQLSAAIVSMEHVTSGYDETKPLSLFLFDVQRGSVTLLDIARETSSRR